MILDNPYDAGWDACFSSYTRLDCPYTEEENDFERRAWLEGFYDAEEVKYE